MSGEVGVRAATVEDAFGLATVHVASWQWAYAGIFPADQLVALSVESRAQRWRSNLERASDNPARTSLAVRDGQVVGFVTVGPAREDAGGPEFGELYGLYVVPEVAGTGVGRQLHDRGVAELTGDLGYGTSRLWVHEANDLARRFYERQGWRSDGVTKSETLQEGFVAAEIRYSRTSESAAGT